MKTRWTKWYTFLCLVALIGCSAHKPPEALAPTPVVPSIVFSQGELQGTYGASFDRTWEATLIALEDERIPVIRLSKIQGGEITARGTEQSTIRIRVEDLGPNTSKVKIRVGKQGDEEISRNINGQIAYRLGIKND
jgi:hypothetical protein